MSLLPLVPLARVNPKDLALHSGPQTRDKRRLPRRSTTGSPSTSPCSHRTTTLSLAGTPPPNSIRKEEPRSLNPLHPYTPFHLLNDENLLSPPPQRAIIPQTLIPDPARVITFSRGGVPGIPQRCFTDIGEIDDGDRWLLCNGEKKIDLVIAWPGYPKAVYSIDIYKRGADPYQLSFIDSSPMLYPTERPILVKELVSEVLGLITTWYMTRALQLEGPEVDEHAPYGWKIGEGFSDVRLDQILLTKFGPVLDGDETLWVTELVKNSSKVESSR